MVKNKWIKKYRKELLLSIYLLLAPFLIYLHLLFDDESFTINFFGYIFHHGSASTQFFVWLLITELTGFILLVLMFFNLEQKWKYVLFIPLSIYLLDLTRLSEMYIETSMKVLIFRIVVIALFVASLIILDEIIYSRKRKRSLIFKMKTLIDLRFNRAHIHKIKPWKNNETQSSNLASVSKLSRLYQRKLYVKNLIDRYTLSEYSVKSNKSNWIKLSWFFLIFLSSALRVGYAYIPSGKTSFIIGPILIEANGFLDASIFLWFISLKIMILVPLVIWYFNAYSWWRYALLSPIILYFYQFWESFQEVSSVDSYGNFKVFPLVLLSMLLVLILSRVVRQQSHTLDTYEQISLEIDRLIKSLSEERGGLHVYRKRYHKILGKLVNKNSEESQLLELTRLQEELQGKIA